MLLLAACSGGSKGQEVQINLDSVGTPVDGTLKVALLTPGTVNDSGWSAIAYSGLKAIESELGAEVNHQVTKDAGIKDAMRGYAQEGYHLVIGHGYEYNGPAAEIGDQFPKTTFVSSSGGLTKPNVGAFRFYLEEGFYLAGMLAAKMTKTGRVGMIGGPDVPSIRSTFKAFAAGAESVNPSIVVIEKFTGKNDDVALAKQATLQAINEGADVLIHQVNNAFPGFFSACEERKAWSFGANENQNDVSTSVLASAVIRADKVFVDLATKVKEGRYRGGINLVGMEAEAIDFVLNAKNSSAIPADAKALINGRQLDMVAGLFKTPKDDF